MRTFSWNGALAALAILAAVGCSSGGQASDAAADGASACGDGGPCSSAQLCVSQQNCGTPACSPVPDGGVCPAGSSATPSCPGTGQAGCLGGCPVSFACQARPAACAATVDCTCAASLCAPGTCLGTTGSQVACGAL